jgi:hypothetical protein
MKKLALAVVAALLASSAASAHADEWYGWQIMLADAASIGVMFAGANAGGQSGDTLMALGATGFILGGPTVHVAHADYLAAGADVGLRAGLTFGGAYIGARLEPDGGEFAGFVGAATGVALGGLGAMVIDYALLSTSRHPEERREWVTVAPTKGGAVVGLGGRF